MARGAGQVGVAIREQEAGLAVIKCGVKKGVKIRVALNTIRCLKLGRQRTAAPRNRQVRWIRGLLKIRQVARIAIGRKTQVISRSRVLVALFALHNCVLAEQWKPIEVLLNRLHRNLPAQHRVALRAVAAELGAVNVRMAIGAVLANVGENRLGMAACAGHFFVHSTKRVPCGVVIKFRNSTDRGPSGGGVAIFAGDIQWSVRTSARLPLRRCRRNASEAEKYDHNPASHWDPRGNGCIILSKPTLICSKEGH
jgi:hypothetical protein